MIHHVFANRSNVGDWLSAIGIQTLLAPLAVEEHLCDEPFVPETLEALGALGPRDVVVIGGGGLFMDYFAPFWEGFAEVAPRVPFAVWGVGFVDLKTEPSRASWTLLREVLRHARVCRVRDELTREILGDLDLPQPVACPSLAAVPARPSAERSLLHAANYSTVGATAYDRMREVGQAFAARTGRVYRETDNTIPAGRRPALDAVLDLYARADLVLSSRLHGVLLALATGRKVLAVSGDRKMEAFMEAAGLGRYVLDAGRLGDLDAALEALPEQPDVRPFLDRAVEENRAVARGVRSLASP